MIPVATMIALRAKYTARTQSMPSQAPTPPGTPIARYMAYNNTYLKVNSDGSGGLVADGSMVGRWDDTTGNGNHLMLFAANRGAIYNAAGGCQFFSRTDGGTTASVMAKTSGLSISRQAVSGLIICDIYGTEHAGILAFGPSSNDIAFQSGKRASLNTAYFFNGASFVDTSLRPRARGCTIAFRGNATDFRAWVDGTLYTGTALSALTMTSLYLGQFAGGLPGPCRIKEVIVYGSALSDAEMTQLNAYGASKVASVDSTRTVDLLGDSLTLGIGSQSGIAWHQRSEVTNRSGSKWRVAAYGGAYLFSTPAATAAQLVASKGSAEAVVVIWIGTNDIIAGGRTGLQLYTDLTTYTGTLRAAGMKVVVCTLQDFATNRAQATDFNSRVVAGASNFDAIARLDTILTDCTNTTYYTSDGVHLKDAGYALVATEINSKLATI